MVRRVEWWEGEGRERGRGEDEEREVGKEGIKEWWKGKMSGVIMGEKEGGRRRKEGGEGGTKMKYRTGERESTYVYKAVNCL